MLIIPAIDIMEGKVVRLEKGDFNRVKEYGLSPVDFAKKWQDEGATIIHVVDLDGAKTGETKNFDTISKVIGSVGIDVEVGGGIRSEEAVKKYLAAGAERVVLSTKVIEDPGFLLSKGLSENLGRVAISLDIKHMETTEVVTSATGGWLKNGDILIDIPSFMQSVCSVGARFVNFSDISRDG
ncbi:MAG TPA: HisA/HisF-related TIM barrel protein, partial [Candidatus Omnitrophota bacterium]|nr:HisA/HisF-related TIM barrel protein [Candidatus Omnitrophota bacterium]